MGKGIAVLIATGAVTALYAIEPDRPAAEAEAAAVAATPAVDGQPVTLVSADGQRWSAWGCQGDDCVLISHTPSSGTQRVRYHHDPEIGVAIDGMEASEQ
jgi:hypothetical protein